MPFPYFYLLLLFFTLINFPLYTPGDEPVRTLLNYFHRVRCLFQRTKIIGAVNPQQGWHLTALYLTLVCYNEASV